MSRDGWTVALLETSVQRVLHRRLRPLHPDPGPIVNVQVWDLAASAFWRFFGLFFCDSTFLRRCGHSQTLPFSEMAKEDAARFF